MNSHLSEDENRKKFSLTARRSSPSIRGLLSPYATWQEVAYERLKVLYRVGKLLSSFRSVEETFPAVLTLCSTAFPILTAVLIEKKSGVVRSAVWHNPGAKPEQIEVARATAANSFAYLTGASPTERSDLLDQPTESSALADGVPAETAPAEDCEHYISLPLVVDRLPAFGIIQLQGCAVLDEKDLEFVDALADLLSIAVDRFYRHQHEREGRQAEVEASRMQLSSSQAQVTNLEAERELRENFVSLLSHDLRTPLSAMSISAQLIQSEPENSENSESMAARIVRNGNRAEQMITDLLDANRIRSGEKILLDLQEFNLGELITETLAELTQAHGNRFVFNEAGPIRGRWDRRGIRRILENLVSNAVKYGCVETPIRISLRLQDGKACIEVQNFGGLISSQDQASLFQQFRRVQRDQSNGKVGWGIGLTLVRGVAEAHGGTIGVQSEVESGTVFRVLLPLDSGPSADADV